MAKDGQRAAHAGGTAPGGMAQRWPRSFHPTARMNDKPAEPPRPVEVRVLADQLRRTISEEDVGELLSKTPASYSEEDEGDLAAAHKLYDLADRLEAMAYDLDQSREYIREYSPTQIAEMPDEVKEDVEAAIAATEEARDRLRSLAEELRTRASNVYERAHAHAHRDREWGWEDEGEPEEDADEDEDEEEEDEEEDVPPEPAPARASLLQRVVDAEQEAEAEIKEAIHDAVQTGVEILHTLGTTAFIEESVMGGHSDLAEPLEDEVVEKSQQLAEGFHVPVPGPSRRSSVVERRAAGRGLIGEDPVADGEDAAEENGGAGRRGRRPRE
eukprot:tig00021036_g17326.t1